MELKLPTTKKFWFSALFIGFILLSPLLLHLAWVLKPEKKIGIILIDKTVADQKKNEHASFNWLLHNQKIVKKTRTLYSLDDYYGFFPQKNERFYISDFEKLNTAQLQELVYKNDIIYITDSYGVYSNEWYKHQRISERSNLIYGGLTEKEIRVLQHFKNQKKLIIAEFNCIGSPTKNNVRTDFEELFHIKWTGWIGRYFENLLESNEDIPRWLINNYKSQHNNNWTFKKSGIAFVNENDQIEILEEGRDLVSSVPAIYSTKENTSKFSIPEKISYPYWFDIIQTDNTNMPVSLYHIQTTARGDSIMEKNNILKTFPATLEHSGDDYRFYYFAGDFADNIISQKMSHYSGVAYIKSILSSFHEEDREDFYWNYYYPLMSFILKDYYKAQLKAE